MSLINKEEELSKDTLRDIEKARKEIKKGHYYTHEQVKRLLDL